MGRSDKSLDAMTGPQTGLCSGPRFGLPVDSARFLGPRVSAPPPLPSPQRNGGETREVKGSGAPLFCVAPTSLGGIEHSARTGHQGKLAHLVGGR